MHKRSIWLALPILLLLAGGLWWLRAQAPRNPTISAPTLAPGVVVINTPSLMTATVSIPDPTLNPASVNLLRIDANGTSMIVAQMVDNGQNGDQQPGDKIFTARLTMNESQTGEVKFQVSAAIRGILNRSISPMSSLQIWNSTTTSMGLLVSFPSGWEVTPIHRDDPTGTRGVEISTPAEAEYQSSGITIAIERNTTVAAVVRHINSGSSTLLYNRSGWSLYTYQNTSSGAQFLIAVTQRGPDVVRIGASYSEYYVSIVEGLMSSLK